MSIDIQNLIQKISMFHKHKNKLVYFLFICEFYFITKKFIKWDTFLLSPTVTDWIIASAAVIGLFSWVREKLILYLKTLDGFLHNIRNILSCEERNDYVESRKYMDKIVQEDLSNVKHNQRVLCKYIRHKTVIAFYKEAMEIFDCTWTLLTKSPEARQKSEIFQLKEKLSNLETRIDKFFNVAPLKQSDSYNDK